MNLRICIVLILLAALCLASPASAIVADSLKISVEENGDAVVDVRYTLSWIEKAGVLLRVGDPAVYIQKACNEYGNGRANLLSSNMSGATLTIDGLAVRENRTYTTPVMDFTQAEVMLKTYPIISALLAIDLSPTVTEIVFPDGSVYPYYDQLLIPATTHTV